MVVNGVGMRWVFLWRGWSGVQGEAVGVTGDLAHLDALCKFFHI